MDREEILNKVDHTLLAQTATWEEIREILDDAMKYHTASACIPAAYVKQAAEYVQGRLPICTVDSRTDIIPQRSKYLRRKMQWQMVLRRLIWSSILVF